MTSDDLWTVDQCADQWQIKPGTWRYYVATDRAPQPVPGYDAQRRRRWRKNDVLTYPRPGQGARTDLRREDMIITTISKDERHRILDECLSIARSQPEGTQLKGMFADRLEEQLYTAVPVLTILRNCAKASYEADCDRYAAEHPGEDTLLPPESGETRLFDAAHEATLRAFIFGHRV